MYSLPLVLSYYNIRKKRLCYPTTNYDSCPMSLLLLDRQMGIIMKVTNKYTHNNNKYVFHLSTVHNIIIVTTFIKINTTEVSWLDSSSRCALVSESHQKPGPSRPSHSAEVLSEHKPAEEGSDL